MKRKKPLRRKTRLRSRSRTNSYRRRVRDLPHLRKVKTFPCVVRELVSEDHRTPCAGPVQADHVGRRGIGQKCDDKETISICQKHHDERTNFYGTFADWNQGIMREWLERALRLTEQRIAARKKAAR